MKIKCIKENFPLGNTITNTGLKVGEIYTVYGLTCEKIENNIIPIEYEIYNGYHIISEPINVIEIIDNNPSKYWIQKDWEDNTITFWPELFYEEYFFDRFSDYDVKLRIKFEQLKILIENEFEI